MFYNSRLYGNQNSSLPTIYLNLTGYLQSRVLWCLNFILTNTLKSDFSFQDLQFKTYPITLYSTNALFDTSKVSTKLREVMRMDSISQWGNLTFILDYSLVKKGLSNLLFSSNIGWVNWFAYPSWPPKINNWKLEFFKWSQDLEFFKLRRLGL